MEDGDTVKQQEFQYKAEMKQLLNLIVHSLYKNPEIFLRELISNSSDALNKVRFRRLTDRNIVDPEAELKIQINLDKENNIFTIEDTGIGMTKKELIEEIGTVAKSGTLEYLQKLKEQNQAPDESLIGRFGVGFYSVFMVTEQVTVETRSAEPASKGYRWISSGQDKFTIEELDRKERGTKIYFKLKDEYKEFAEEARVKEVLKKYSNFVDFPIFVGSERVNTVQALWHKKKDEITQEELNEFYKFITNDFQDPLGHLKLDIEGNVNFNALIFVPQQAPPNFMMQMQHKERTLHLYSSKVFIQDNCQELLPDYLKFVEGVVDTEDLPLNVSRETIQNSPVVAKIRNVLTGKILSMLEDWAQNDKNKYEQFYRNFGSLLKTGINSDFSHKDRIVELLRFESTMLEKGKLTSLKEYTTKMRDDQKEIYYISGDNREQIERNPNLEYFRKNEIEVLLFTDPIDVFVVPSINEYDGKPLKSIEKADLDFKDEEESEGERLGEDASKSLIQVFKETLGDKVEDVIESKRLVESPATLVVGQQGMDPQMEKVMQMMDQQYQGSKRILEINTKHPLIKNLSTRNIADSNDPVLRKTITQLYEGAMLMEGYLQSPDEFVRRMNELLVEATGSK